MISLLLLFSTSFFMLLLFRCLNNIFNWKFFKNFFFNLPLQFHFCCGREKQIIQARRAHNSAHNECIYFLYVYSIGVQKNNFFCKFFWKFFAKVLVFNFFPQWQLLFGDIHKSYPPMCSFNRYIASGGPVPGSRSKKQVRNLGPILRGRVGVKEGIAPKSSIYVVYIKSRYYMRVERKILQPVSGIHRVRVRVRGGKNSNNISKSFYLLLQLPLLAISTPPRQGERSEP